MVIVDCVLVSTEIIELGRYQFSGSSVQERRLVCEHVLLNTRCAFDLFQSDYLGEADRIN